MNFNELTNICKNIASDLHTMVEIDDYKEYGWAAIAFINWYGHKNARKVETVDQLKMMVKYYMKKELKARDLDGLYDFINSQY